MNIGLPGVVMICSAIGVGGLSLSVQIWKMHGRAMRAEQLNTCQRPEGNDHG